MSFLLCEVFALRSTSNAPCCGSELFHEIRTRSPGTKDREVGRKIVIGRRMGTVNARDAKSIMVLRMWRNFIVGY